MDFPRGNLPGSVTRKTSDYCCGASLVFPRDCFGSDAQAAECWPVSQDDSARVLNDAAALLQDSFAWAAAAGIDSCLGTEIPLTKPPGSNATIKELYEGLFARVAAATPAKVSSTELGKASGAGGGGARSRRPPLCPPLPCPL